jgi:predicted glycosyltransferase
MELIYLSDIVINFSSTAIKECALLRKPVVNFNVKPYARRLDELYSYEYCIELDNDFSRASIEKAVKDLTTKDLSNAFNLVQSERLFEPGFTSEKILDIL